MANGAGTAGPPTMDDTTSGPESSGQGPPAPGGPPPGGGPMLAAMARSRQGPQVSAPGGGDTANSMTMIMNAISMIQQALPGLPAGSQIHRDVVRAISSLSRHAQQASQTSAGVQKTQLQDMLRSTLRNALLHQIMGQQQGGQGGGPGGGPGGPPGGGPGGAPPMPSTPLPGA